MADAHRVRLLRYLTVSLCAAAALVVASDSAAPPAAAATADGSAVAHGWAVREPGRCVRFRRDRNGRRRCVKRRRRKPPISAGPRGNPFSGARLFVQPDSPARRQADEWRSRRPADAELMARLAKQPVATWFGDWNEDVRGAVARHVARARAARAMPVLVAYAIPQRDCGGYSSGGTGSPGAYRDWIRRFAAGLGQARAAVIVEPDALAGLDCLSQADRATRLRLVAGAVRTLSADRNAAVYLDAGHSGWQSPAVIAERLRGAGVARARGFALNVSNFRRTADEARYGQAVAGELGGDVPFVIDTSRNGAGPASDGAWCNPPGRALGRRPTVATGVAMVDAYLWVKVPGESDGKCNGGPPAGTWWPEYALGLARRARW